MSDELDVVLTAHHDLELDPDNPNVVCVNLTGESQFTIQLDPNPIGYWAIEENFHVPVYVAPSAWRRWWTRRLLGWKWIVEVNSSVR